MLFMPLRSSAFAQVLLRKTGCFATTRLAGKTTHSDANCCYRSYPALYLCIDCTRSFSSVSRLSQRLPARAFLFAHKDKDSSVRAFLFVSLKQNLRKMCEKHPKNLRKMCKILLKILEKCVKSFYKTRKNV